MSSFANGGALVEDYSKKMMNESCDMDSIEVTRNEPHSNPNQIHDPSVNTTWTEFLAGTATDMSVNKVSVDSRENSKSMEPDSEQLLIELESQDTFSDDILGDPTTSWDDGVPTSVSFADRSDDGASVAVSSVSGDLEMASPKEQHSAPLLLRTNTMSSQIMEFTNSLIEGSDEYGSAVMDLNSSNRSNKRYFVASLKSCGDSAFRSQDFKQAKVYYLEALEAQSTILRAMDQPDKKPSTMIFFEKQVAAELQMCLGMAYGATDKLKRAQEHFHKSLAIYEEVIEQESYCGMNARKTLKIFGSAANKIGNMFYRHRQFHTALSFYKVALENPYFPILPSDTRSPYLISDVDIKVDPEVWENGVDEGRLEKDLLLCRADTLNNMANVYNVTSQYSKSISLYNQAIQIQAAILGEDDPIVATTLHNVGTCFCREGKFTLALKTYKEVIALGQKSDDGTPERIVDSMAGIAVTLHTLGETHQAIAAYSEALEVAPHAYGCKHLKVAGLHNAIGELYKEVGEKETALSHFREGYSIYIANKCYKKEPEMRRCRRNIKKMGIDPDNGLPRQAGSKMNYFALSDVVSTIVGTRSAVEP